MADYSSIRVGQILRVPYRGSAASLSGFVSYLDVTRRIHSKSADLQKGMFFYEEVDEPDQAFRRVPAFIFHSNPFKKGAEATPWVDAIDPDAGYCLFHGDNRKVGRPPLEARGNARFSAVLPFYADPMLRKFAPPVLVFEQAEFGGGRRGYRRFCGFGVPVRCSLTTQKEMRSGYFTNLVAELVLFRLERENEVFSWNWIDRRRDGKITSDSALSAAPWSWREWVARGPLAIESCRRVVARRTLVEPSVQLSYTSEEKAILTEVMRYYAKRKHSFEGLASFVAERILGSQCMRGWVTKRSGDGGVDFVCRLNVGDAGEQLSRARTVVLGQAKCVAPHAAIGGHAVARVVARLQRGWIGVFVTTGVFSRAAQLELAEDKYPIILINGRRVAQALFEVVTQERIPLNELFDRESDWYRKHLSHVPPGRILEDGFSFNAIQQAADDSLNDETQNN